VVPVLFVPVIAVFGALALGELGPGHGPRLAAAGYVLWTLTEYWLHRVVFHFEPEAGIGRPAALDDPRRPPRPPQRPHAPGHAAERVRAAGRRLRAALPGRAPFGPACAVSAGFFLGYLAYDMTHFYVHHRRPRTWVGRKLRELHMRHHFQDHNAGFGVSAPWWDVVFGTAPRSKRP
jgi:sterol desaturase/sphingolipid hydroxylase (fatty acid hydroxylase superfamily)